MSWEHRNASYTLPAESLTARAGQSGMGGEAEVVAGPSPTPLSRVGCRGFHGSSLTLQFLDDKWRGEGGMLYHFGKQRCVPLPRARPSSLALSPGDIGVWKMCVRTFPTCVVQFSLTPALQDPSAKKSPPTPTQTT